MQRLPLDCPRCKARIGVRKFFDSCRVSWPNQRWTHFHCPMCGKYSQIQLNKGTVEFGELDGAPGPCFFPDRLVAITGLGLRVSDVGLLVSYGTYKRFLPAKR